MVLNGVNNCTEKSMRAAYLWALAPWLLVACADDGGVTVTTVEDWHTEAEYEIGDQGQGDALFGTYLDLLPAPDGSRVYVLDSQASEVTIWTPDGELIKRLGRAGGGPGEFQMPSRLAFVPQGFYVKDMRRTTTFTLDGELVGTDAYPQGVEFHGFRVQIWDIFNDGSFAAMPLPAFLAGSSTSDPTEELPMLRIVADEGAWRADELARLSLQNWQASIEVEERERPIPLRQPWVAPDNFEVDHLNGSVVVKRALTTSPGLLEFIEISVAGDTLWARRIQLPPIPLTQGQIEAEVEEEAAMVAGLIGVANASPMLKSRIRAAWHIPEYWPVAREIRLMSNGEIWFESPGSQTPVWYAVAKGAPDGPIKRITVPESFQPLDVTTTHIWGVRRDELDVGYVTGLRLLPGQ